MSTVQFDVTQAFAPHVLMADDHLAFDIAGLRGDGRQAASSTRTRSDPTAKKTIMPLTFNYPVDPAEFEKRIALALSGRDGKIRDAAQIHGHLRCRQAARPGSIRSRWSCRATTTR